jgi:hypothetical protein
MMNEVPYKKALLYQVFQFETLPLPTIYHTRGKHNNHYATDAVRQRSGDPTYNLLQEHADQYTSDGV